MPFSGHIPFSYISFQKKGSGCSMISSLRLHPKGFIVRRLVPRLIPIPYAGFINTMQPIGKFAVFKKNEISYMKIINLIIFATLFILGFITDESNSNKTDEINQKQDPKITQLSKEILELDSILFNIGFNLIDTAAISKLIHPNIEFYHDVHGLSTSKSTFLNNIQGIEDLPFKTWRTLLNESTEVFPLYKNNHSELYGIIQNGVHEFYQQKDDETAVKTNIAKFTHLWLLENENWILKQVLSFDHQVPQ